MTPDRALASRWGAPASVWPLLGRATAGTAAAAPAAGGGGALRFIWLRDRREFWSATAEDDAVQRGDDPGLAGRVEAMVDAHAVIDRGASPHFERSELGDRAPRRWDRLVTQRASGVTAAGGAARADPRTTEPRARRGVPRGPRGDDSEIWRCWSILDLPRGDDDETRETSYGVAGPL